MKTKLLIILFLLGCFNSVLNAQQTESIASVPSIPTSPQAAALKQYGNFEISYFYGTPDISIPLYEINHHGYRLPVVLRYSPLPIKPNYNYDVFGHGWSLSINSCISRSIEYKPDEASNFKLAENLQNEYNNNPNNLINHNYAYDKFHATLPDGSSFDFIIKEGPTFIVSEGRSLKITCSYTTSNINSFEIIDENGIKYSFAEGDKLLKDTNTSHPSSYVSWRLTKIELPNSTQPISFTYGKKIKAPFPSSYWEARVDVAHELKTEVLDYPMILHNPTNPQNGYQMQLLSKISWGGCVIELSFESSEAEPTQNHVNKIKVREGDNTVKDIDLNMYKYSINNFGKFNLAKLREIVFKDVNGLPNKEVYKCEYEGIETSFSGTDHWGNSNTGDTKDNLGNFNIFVEFNCKYYGIIKDNHWQIIEEPNNTSKPYYKLKLHRKSNGGSIDFRRPLYPSDSGVLSKLIYPTGGYTKFEFENHKFLSATDKNGDYQENKYLKTVTLGSGFRIRKITNYLADGKVADVKNIRYGKRYIEADSLKEFAGNSEWRPYVHTGLGEATVDPTIFTYMSHSAYQPYSRITAYDIRNMIQGKNISLYVPFTSPGNRLDTPWKWQCTFTPDNFRRLLNGRPSVIYSHVTVYHGEIDQSGRNYTPENTIGKTEYIYDYVNDYTNEWGQKITSLTYRGNTLTYDPCEHYYNRLTRKIDYVYDESKPDKYRAVKQEKNYWNIQFTSYMEYINENPYPPGINPPARTQINQFMRPRYPSIGREAYVAKKVTETYLENNTVSHTETYSMNKNQLTKHTIYNSDNYMYSTQFKYPGTVSSGEITPIIQKLLDKNMLSSVLEKTVKKESESGGERVSSRQKIVYNNFNNFILPETIYKLKSNISNSELKKEMEIVEYSPNGNPRIIKYFGRLPEYTMYLWGYNDQYIIAKIDGNNLINNQNIANAIKEIFGKTIEELAKHYPSKEELNTLSLHKNLSDLHITTFTYTPGLGVTSITEPSGKTIYFEYDGLGRLTKKYFIENGQKKILEANEYKLYDQN